MASPEQESDTPASRDRSSRIVRLKIWFLSLLGFWVMRIVGSTLRWQVEGWENYQAIRAANRSIIFASWHGRLFLGTCFWRKRGIVVMSSTNRDSEYLARVLRRFGFGLARGSSSQGARHAVVEMIRSLRDNYDVGFTIDGPRGPRYVAKLGAVWIASKTGSAIFPSHMSAERKWVFEKSWDLFHFPKPFSRVLVLLGPPIYVRENASREELAESLQALQNSLDEMMNKGDSYWENLNRAVRSPHPVS